MGNSTETAPAKHCLPNHSNLSFHLAAGSQLCIGSLCLGPSTFPQPKSGRKLNLAVSKRHCYQFVIKAKGYGVTVLFAQWSEPPHGMHKLCIIQMAVFDAFVSFQVLTWRRELGVIFFSLVNWLTGIDVKITSGQGLGKDFWVGRGERENSIGKRTHTKGKWFSSPGKDVVKVTMLNI